jgi:hypothetical protein
MYLSLSILFIQSHTFTPLLLMARLEKPHIPDTFHVTRHSHSENVASTGFLDFYRLCIHSAGMVYSFETPNSPAVGSGLDFVFGPPIFF